MVDEEDPKRGWGAALADGERQTNRFVAESYIAESGRMDDNRTTIVAYEQRAGIARARALHQALRVDPTKQRRTLCVVPLPQ
jgi:hypothetical protein